MGIATKATRVTTTSLCPFPSWHVSTHWLLYLVGLAVLLLFSALYMRGRTVLFMKGKKKFPFTTHYCQVYIVVCCFLADLWCTKVLITHYFLIQCNHKHVTPFRLLLYRRRNHYKWEHKNGLRFSVGGCLCRKTGYFVTSMFSLSFTA